ncbi:WD repeat, SAM and U-box domain-containing protein 1-like [Diretmus argenteus]
MVSVICTLRRHRDEVNCCAFSPTLLATCSGDKTVRVYDTSDFSELPYSPLTGHGYGVHCCRFSSCGGFLVTCSTDGSTVAWSSATGEVWATLQHPGRSPVRVCALAPDSSLLRAGASDGTVSLWDFRSKQLRSCSPVSEASVVACCFSPCGQMFVVGCTQGDVKLWDVDVGLLHAEKDAHDLGVTCCSFAPQYNVDGCCVEVRLASCGQDSQLKIWIVSQHGAAACDMKLLHTLTGQSAPVLSCAFSSDGELVVSGSVDKTVAVYDVNQGTLLHTLKQHDRYVTAVASSPIMPWIATGSMDRTVTVWRIGDADSGTAKRLRQGAERLRQDGGEAPSGGGEAPSGWQRGSVRGRRGSVRMAERLHQGAERLRQGKGSVRMAERLRQGVERLRQDGREAPSGGGEAPLGWQRGSIRGRRGSVRGKAPSGWQRGSVRGRRGSVGMAERLRQGAERLRQDSREAPSGWRRGSIRGRRGSIRGVERHRQRAERFRQDSGEALSGWRRGSVRGAERLRQDGREAPSEGREAPSGGRRGSVGMAERLRQRAERLRQGGGEAPSGWQRGSVRGRRGSVRMAERLRQDGREAPSGWQRGSVRGAERLQQGVERLRQGAERLRQGGRGTPSGGRRDSVRGGGEAPSGGGEAPSGGGETPSGVAECRLTMCQGRNSRLLVADWSEEDVGTWLREEGLEKLVSIFKANNIDGPELTRLNEDTVVELGIGSVGLRGRLLRKIGALKVEQSGSEAPDEFLCPITRDLMKDPVIAADGYSYEREAIESWIRAKNKSSPMTNLPLQTTLVTPNRSLKMAIARWTSSQ